MRALLLVVLLAVAGCKDKDPNDGWCCAKSRKFCKPVTTCIDKAAYYCVTYEQQEQCDNLCDEWRVLAGADGGSCPAGAGAIKTPGCP